MTTVKAHIRVASDGTLTGHAPGLPAGEHDAEIVLVENGAAAGPLDTPALLARVRAIQAEMAQLPVLDERSPDEIVGYSAKQTG